MVLPLIYEHKLPYVRYLNQTQFYHFTRSFQTHPKKKVVLVITNQVTSVEGVLQSSEIQVLALSRSCSLGYAHTRRSCIVECTSHFDKIWWQWSLTFKICWHVACTSHPPTAGKGALTYIASVLVNCHQSIHRREWRHHLKLPLL